MYSESGSELRVGVVEGVVKFSDDDEDFDNNYCDIPDLFDEEMDDK